MPIWHRTLLKPFLDIPLTTLHCLFVYFAHFASTFAMVPKIAMFAIVLLS